MKKKYQWAVIAAWQKLESQHRGSESPTVSQWQADQHNARMTVLVFDLGRRRRTDGGRDHATSRQCRHHAGGNLVVRFHNEHTNRAGRRGIEQSGVNLLSPRDDLADLSRN